MACLESVVDTDGPSLVQKEGTSYGYSRYVHNPLKPINKSTRLTNPNIRSLA